MDVGRWQPSETFVISRASLRSACKVVSRSQLRFADGRDGRRDGYWLSLPRASHADVLRGSSRVPAPPWGGLLRDEPKGPSAHEARAY